MKYTWDQFKADSVTGLLNGITFGLIFSFFTHPFQFQKPQSKQRYQGRTLFYYRSWMWRMALGFAILRTSYNAISKQQMGTGYELGAMAAISIGVTQALF